MIMKFDSGQMNGMLSDDDDFVEYFTTVIIPKHLPTSANVAHTRQTADMVRWGRRYAEYFGFDDPIYQVHFVVLMWKIGPDFFEFEPYRRIIQDRTLSQEQKMERCNLEPTLEQEGHAITKSDYKYWFPQYLKNNILGVPYDDAEEQYLLEKDKD